jgi:flagellar hook-length control protein FliK
MIPADVITRLKLPTELLTQPSAVTSAHKTPSDVLNEFTPGQRLMATIQSLLPNGVYRAVVAGRELTLALPFAAQAGDQLELEVVEQNGKAALAMVADRAASAGTGAAGVAEGEANASVATRLTVTGRLISELLGSLDKEGGKRPQPAPLNNAQPVVNRFPAEAAELVPALKAALTKSGMFYEAHQAQWVAGKTSLATLLTEPQGRLSPVAHVPGQQVGAATGAAATVTNAANAANATAGNVAAQGNLVAQNNGAAAQASAVAPNAATTSGVVDGNVLRVGMGQVVAQELAPLVQQQLEALATNSYVWQGQIWPGQNMDWEIVEEDGGRERSENTAPNWTTHLRLTLPRLGGVDATLRLIGGKEIEIRLRAENPETRALLNAANGPLQKQFVTAGLKLGAFSVSRPRAEQAHGAREDA